MTDQQCGLCLSCGAPFLPEITQVDFFNRQANLSILFLNTEFQENRDIRRMYDYPKLCSERQASHMIHRAYHQTALDYMCNRHTLDSDVGLPLPGGLGPRQVHDANNEPFLYYHTASTRHGPQGAVWPRPLANTRIDLGPLLAFLRTTNRTGRYVKPVAPSFDVMYDMCAGCNLLMTQKSHMRFILGCRNAGTKNTRGKIIRRDAFNQYNAEANGHQLENAYGHWRLQNNARPRPRLIKTDSDAPCIAYYLHMCLPFRIADGQDGFEMFGVNMRKPVRTLYLELSWLLLEIACLATLLEEGTVTKPRNSKKSHGQHQHLGVLDLYVSYFMWRLMQFEFGRLIARTSLDFVQWHQKYFADARNCPGLLDANEQRVTTGTLMYGTSNQSGQALVSQLCTNIMRFYSVKLSDMIVHAVGPDGNIPSEISNYFALPAVIRLLRTRSNQVSLLIFCHLTCLKQ